MTTTRTQDRWQRADALFEAALDLPSEERRAYLSRACREDTEIRHQVERLLAHCDTGDTLGAATGVSTSVARGLACLFLEAQGQSVGDGHEAPEEITPRGTLVGPYRVLRELGRGGMAVVYLAHRVDEDVEGAESPAADAPPVALKRMKKSLDTVAGRERFRREAEFLAQSRHASVPRYLGAGEDQDGRPYFVMEYVEGRHIDEYCAAEGLSVRQRLEVFLQVARAVAYTHSRQVVHRDIKPANILVSPRGQAKLLDFGIAEDTDPDGASGAISPSGACLMTPAYASPEQVRGQAVTPASDVYQLGLLLFRLLTGASPYRLNRGGYGELARAICEDEPSRPSALEHHSGTVTRSFADAWSDTRGGEASHATGDRPAWNCGDTWPSHPLARGLDRIVLKALRKAPQERYGSVESFIDDVEEYLRGGGATGAPPPEAELGGRHRATLVA